MSQIVIDVQVHGKPPDHRFEFKLGYPDGLGPAEIAAVLKIVVRNLEKEAEG